MAAAAEEPVAIDDGPAAPPAVVEEELAGIVDLSIAPDTPFRRAQSGSGPSVPSGVQPVPARAFKDAVVQTDLRLPTNRDGVVAEVANIERLSHEERE